MQIANALGNLHPLLIHLPIVLLPLAVAIDIVAWWRKDDRLSWCGYWLTLLGTAGAVVAFVCGILAELYAARAGVPQAPIEVHEWMATFAVWTFIALTVARILVGMKLTGKTAVPYLLVGLVACALLVVAAHRGGQVTYAYGANVGGVELRRVMSDEDVAVLAQHQDETGLQYSNQMHWIFGWIVLALALSVFLERLPVGRLRELRRLMPFVFMAGGVYLMIYSDWDSWPLSTLRSVLDPEVLLHKVIAVFLFGMGVLQLRAPSDAAPSVWQNRVIAVMAAIGGSLMFTHVHTNAPYTNVAVGVYLNHTALGLAAFGVAASVLLADAFPESKKIALLFPCFLLLEALLLVTYYEDLPWFLGYGKISNRPVFNGVLAHVPGGRGELTFDKRDGTIEIHLIGSHDGTPMKVDEPRLVGTIEARQRTFPVVFERVGDGLYRLQLAWLRQVPVFNVRLSGPLATEFDPVVTAPLLTPLEGVEKVYACPMCPDVISSIEGTCPMCGMGLTALPKPILKAPKLPPHDEGVTMDVAVEGRAEAGRPARLRFVMKDARGQTVTSFRVMHEKLMHLIIVRDDLVFFAHEHPERQADGSFTLDFTFPSGGGYVLFADVAPADGRPQGFRMPLTVEGAPAADTATPEVSLIQQQGPYTFTLDTGELPLKAGRESQLTVSICKDGRPLDDLGAWLGAVGHCVILSQDTKAFIHAHALQLTAVPTPAGPAVAFHAIFPQPGRYRVWTQFFHDGRVLTADFTVRVH